MSAVEPLPKRLIPVCHNLPGLLQSVSLTQVRPLWTQASTRDYQHSQASLSQSLVGSLLLFPVSWCSQDFICVLQESVSPVLWKFCNQILLTLKVRFPGGGVHRDLEPGTPVDSIHRCWDNWVSFTSHLLNWKAPPHGS